MISLLAIGRSVMLVFLHGIIHWIALCAFSLALSFDIVIGFILTPIQSMGFPHWSSLC
jgi:hypothetical protein